MPTLEINGRDVEVDDSFLSLSPEDQNSTVDEIAASMGANDQPQAQPEGPGFLSTIGDVAKAAPSALARGTADFIGLPGTIADGMNAAGDWAMRHGYEAVTGSVPEPGTFFGGGANGPIRSPISGDTLRGGLSSVTGGASDYEPKTTMGKYVRTGAEFLPGAVAFGGASIPALARNLAAPALSSETAGQLTEGTWAEPYARMAGALLGGVAGNATAGKAVPSTPTAKEIFEKGGDIYENAKPILKDTTLTNDAYRQIVDSLKGVGDDFGMVPEAHGSAMRFLRRHDKAAGDFRPGGMIDDAPVGMTSEDAIAKLSRDGSRQEGRVLNQLTPSAGKAPPRPQSLSEFVAGQGGIVDYKGEAASIAGGVKTRNGRIVRDDGKKSLDSMREVAEEAGYLGDYTADEFGRASVSDFLRALDDDVRGTKVFARSNVSEEGALDAWDAQQAARSSMRDNLDRIGQELPGKVSDDVVARAGHLMESDRIAPREALQRAIADDIFENGQAPQSVPAGMFPDIQNPNVSAVGGAEPSLYDVELMRRGLGHIGNSNMMNKSLGALSGKLTDKLDEGVQGLDTPSFKVGNATDADDALKKLATARETWRTGIKSQAIENAIDHAGNAKSGFENGLRIEFGKLLKPKFAKNYNATELEAIKRVANGTFTQNALRWIGGFGVPLDNGRNFLGSVIGAVSGNAIAGPVGAVALPALGSAAKFGASSVALKNAGVAQALIRSGKKGTDAYRTAIEAQKEARRMALARALLLGSQSSRQGQ